MLSAAMVREIRRLLEAGRLSQRQIARKLGVSRGVVSAIALGRRPEDLERRVCQARCAAAQRCERGACRCTSGSSPTTCPGTSADVADYYAGQLPSRCRGCGGTVYLPCVLCATRAWAQRQRHMT
jgi:hypothetical protein